MSKSRVMTVFLLLIASSVAEGQGGLIKKKLGDALKKKAEPAKAAEGGATPAEPKFAFDFTPAAMASFKAGVEIEVKKRQEYRAVMAKSAEVKKCSDKAITSPAGMKVVEEYQKKMESVKTPDDMTKASQWMGDQLKVVAQKQCGDDPAAKLESQSTEFGKAELAGAREFAKGWTRTSPKDDAEESGVFPTEIGESAPSDVYAAPYDESVLPGSAFTPRPTACAGTGTTRPVARVVVRADTLTDQEKEDEYRRLKELLEFFCKLTDEQKQEARDKGIRIQGSGPGIWWVFTRGFAIWVGDDCAFLLKLFGMLT